MVGVGSLPKTWASSLALSFPAQPAQVASSVSRIVFSLIVRKSCHNYGRNDIFLDANQEFTTSSDRLEVVAICRGTTNLLSVGRQIKLTIVEHRTTIEHLTIGNFQSFIGLPLCG